MLTSQCGHSYILCVYVCVGAPVCRSFSVFPSFSLFVLSDSLISACIYCFFASHTDAEATNDFFQRRAQGGVQPIRACRSNKVDATKAAALITDGRRSALRGFGGSVSRNQSPLSVLFHSSLRIHLHCLSDPDKDGAVFAPTSKRRSIRPLARKIAVAGKSGFLC